MNAELFDALSWIGLVLCIGAFFIKDIFKLRLTTLVGCLLMATYYIHISVPQGMVSNIVIIMINGVYLYRMTRAQREISKDSELDLPKEATAQ